MEASNTEGLIGAEFKIEVKGFASNIFAPREVIDAYIFVGGKKIHHPMIISQVLNNERLVLVNLHRTVDWQHIKKNDQIDIVTFKGHSLIKSSCTVVNFKLSSDGIELELSLPRYGQRFEQRRHVRVNIPLMIRLIDDQFNIVFQSKYVHENNLSVGGLAIYIGKTKLQVGQTIKFELKAYFDAEDQLSETELRLNGKFTIVRIIGDTPKTRMACGFTSNIDQLDDYIAKYIMRYQQFLIRTGRGGVAVKS